MTQYNHLSQIYRSVIQQVMSDPAQLPSLPAFTFEIRRAVQNAEITNEALAAICAKDPGFVALLISAAASPLYARTNPPTTIGAIIAVLGREKIDRLAMIYSIKSLFIFRTPKLKQVYNKVWERTLLTSAIGVLLAKKYTHFNVEETIMVSLLVELGTLAILSALKDMSDFPTPDEFKLLCREYGKSFTAIMLKKWRFDDQLIEVLKSSGRWYDNHSDVLTLTDILNLAWYCALKVVGCNGELPPIRDLAAFAKLPVEAQRLDHNGLLSVLSENRQEISSIQKLLA